MQATSMLARLVGLLCGLLVARSVAEGVPAEIRITDAQTGQPVPARVHLTDATGKPVRAGKLPFFRDHFVCPGAARLELAPGQYAYVVERGPEWESAAGSFTVTPAGEAKAVCSLRRLVDLGKEGWWAGDLHIHRPMEDLALLMEAEDLHIAPVITWWNDQNQWLNRTLPAAPLVRVGPQRFGHLLAGEDEREGGALLYFHLREPLALRGAGREYPSPMKFLAAARLQDGVWVDIEKPFWWDVPVWAASGQVDSVGLANNHMCRDRMYETEAWGKPRDALRLPPPRGNGFWTQEIYYHLLNCGLRIPPSAGSASGVLPNPVGYNRVYVHAGEQLDYDPWWAGLRAGRSFVSNGPLLRCRANGELPGHRFIGEAGKPLKLQLRALLTSRDPVSAFEIIRNGRVERSVPLAEWKATGSLGELVFEQSGWCLVRVVADEPKTFRFASTAPFYVEIGSVKRRISRGSARLFLEWAQERMGRIKLENAVEREEVLSSHRAAEQFWREKLAAANAE